MCRINAPTGLSLDNAIKFRKFLGASDTLPTPGMVLREDTSKSRHKRGW